MEGTLGASATKTPCATAPARSWFASTGRARDHAGRKRSQSTAASATIRTTSARDGSRSAPASDARVAMPYLIAAEPRRAGVSQ